LFHSRTYVEVVEGYIDPFLDFVYNMNEYEGGYPAAIPFRKLLSSTDDSSGMPKHVLNTGKDDP
jgi:hypothetical protein